MTSYCHSVTKRFAINMPISFCDMPMEIATQGLPKISPYFSPLHLKYLTGINPP